MNPAATAMPRLTFCAMPALLGLAFILSGCQERPGQDAQGASAALPPGTISVPFRNRWWHFYERGLSWAEGGDDVRAADDFRQCLRLRQTDSRLARTYGMHFVQCFAHRELGAVLLRQGDLDGAERELRLSLAQEPSAKAEQLLQRIAQQRGGAAAQAVPPPPRPSAPAAERIELASVAPVAGAADRVHVSGRIAGGMVLWQEKPGAPAERVPAEADGSFAADLAGSASLLLGSEAGPDRTQAPAVPLAPPAAAPGLVVDGPDAGAVVADGRAWYRYSAEAAAGLAGLQVEDAHGIRLAQLRLDGMRAAGTLRLDLPAGVQDLRFIVTDRSGGTVQAGRRVDSRPAPQQDRSLRAVALAIPLQSPRPGAMRPGDDPRLMSALIEDGRFRFVDQRADGILARELSLVEAGYVDRDTAAAAGRRLSCRYVIAGTMARGEREAECFLRLVHCESGRVVATADAYAELRTASDADALCAAVAGRLRQVFPVVSGSVARASGGTASLDIGSRSGVVALMRLHVFPEQPAGALKAGEVEVVEVDEAGSRATVVAGSLPVSGRGVSE